MSSILSSKKPLYEINKVLGLKIASFEKERLAIATLLMSHKTDDPCSVLVTGESGGGKSHVMDTILCLYHDNISLADCNMQEYWKTHCVVRFTKASATFFERWGSDVKGFTWNHKIIALPELEGMQTSSPTLRSLLSEGEINSGVVEKNKEKENIETVSRTIKGRPLIYGTTAVGKMEQQFVNRAFVLSFTNPMMTHEERVELSSNVMNKMAENHNRLNDKTFQKEAAIIREEIMNVPIVDHVEIPFGKEIVKEFKNLGDNYNREFSNMLKFISASAVLHSANREKRDGGRVIVAVGDDYEIARRLYCFDLNKLDQSERKVYESIDNLMKSDKVRKRIVLSSDVPVKCATRAEIISSSKVAYKTATDVIKRLIEKNLLSETTTAASDSDYGRPSTVYLFSTKRPLKFPTVDRITDDLVAPYDPLTGKEIKI